MEIWLDTIDVHVIADGVETGIISGVTTNPSILSRAQNVRETAKRLLDLQKGPVAIQVTGKTPEEMVEEARHIYQYSNRMIVKIPVSRKGLIAMKELQKEQIPVLGTAILYPIQALLAANMDVAYLSPYFCHMGDLGNAFETLKTMVNLVRASNQKTKILVASLKHIDHILYCALLGVDAITIKPELYNKLVADFPVVEGFTEKFLSEWMQAHGPSSIKEALL